MQISPERYSAVEAAEAIRNGQLTVVDLATALLDRIEVRPEVQAWAYLDRELIMAEARRLDAIPFNERRSPLFGCTIAIKDIFYTRDMPTDLGSMRYHGHRVALDASIVSVLRAAGLLIFGRAHTVDFAVGLPSLNRPPTRNPHNIEHTPGGSSAGSAAAVADFQCSLSVGTQTGSSTVTPSSYCGIWGYKPSQSLVSLQGASVVAPSLDTPGFFARKVEDLQAVAPLFGIEHTSKASPGCLPRIAWSKTAAWDDTTLGAQKALLLAVECLKKAGMVSEEIVLPEGFAKGKEECRIITKKEFAVAFKGEMVKGREGLTQDRLDYIEDGESIPWSRYAESRDLLAGLKEEFNNSIISKYDALMTLSTSCSAPVDAVASGNDKYGYTWTALKVPVVNVPGLGDDSGMPIGMSIIGAEWDDVHLLDVAEKVGRAFEKHGNWRSKL